MTRKLLCLGVLLALAASLPCSLARAAEAAAPTAPEVAAPAATLPAAEPATPQPVDLAPALQNPASPSCDPAAGALPLTEPGKIPVAGCTASYFCIHGTTAFCSSPFIGTCSSSSTHCGVVTCNGVNTWCPGACNHDPNCASFCGFEEPYHCDEWGCCVCGS